MEYAQLSEHADGREWAHCKTVGTTWPRIVVTAQSLPAQPLGEADCPHHLVGVPGCDINELKQYPGTATVSVSMDVSASVESDFEALVSMAVKLLGARSK
jgi:hypothetical protein